MILGAEIGEECDDRTSHARLLKCAVPACGKTFRAPCLHQERVGDAKVFEQFDVAIQQAALAWTRRRIGAIPERGVIDDDIFL
jgi:hypothetical protein